MLLAPRKHMCFSSPIGGALLFFVIDHWVWNFRAHSQRVRGVSFFFLGYSACVFVSTVTYRGVIFVFLGYSACMFVNTESYCSSGLAVDHQTNEFRLFHICYWSPGERLCFSIPIGGALFYFVDHKVWNFRTHSHKVRGVIFFFCSAIRHVCL